MTSGVVVKTNYSLSVYPGSEPCGGVVLHLANDVYGFLPVGVLWWREAQGAQISDHPSLNDRLLRLFTEGSRINEVGVLNVLPRGSYRLYGAEG